MVHKLFLDTETVGFHGMPILLQYKRQGDRSIQLYEPWKEPVRKTLDLVEWFLEHEIVGFNLVFDHFHLCKLHTIWSLLPPDAIPENIINDIAAVEVEAQNGKCLKPVSAMDLLLHSRKGPYQSLMAREDIRIRKVPSVLAYKLAEELENRVEIDGIYFAKRHDKTAPRWHVYDIPNKERNGIDPNFKDVVLKFYPAGGLKFLAEHALGIADTIKFSEIEIDERYYPGELGYAPYATALSSPERRWAIKDGAIVDGQPVYQKGSFAWPGVIKFHIDHWHCHEKAREYALKDIVYTEGLYNHFGQPEGGDDDSVLACLVAAVRWHGYNVDIEGIKELQAEAMAKVVGKPIAPGPARAYIREVMDETEFINHLRESTKKAKLLELAEWRCDCTYTLEGNQCLPQPECDQCHGDGMHAVARRAAEILEGRMATKECELYEKLITAGKFHASFNVIGTLSSRMSGGDGLNAQGIKREAWVREKFPLAYDPYILCGGDFSSFEVTLADAAYNDPALREDLVNGVKIHAVMAAMLYPELTYEKILWGYNLKADEFATLHPELSGDKLKFEFALHNSKYSKVYSNGKQAVFALIYGGDHTTIHKKLSIPIEIAERAYNTFLRRYSGIARARQKIINMFCSMRQDDGPGSRVVWNDPADKIESLLGFPRYFTLENKICLTLFELANNIPVEWRECRVQVVRRTRQQFACGAVSSALYGAAFQIQAAAMRAAANHVIQSAGAEITKHVERRIWDIQPAGVYDFCVLPANIHDELVTPTLPEYTNAVNKVVNETVESYRDRVPLIGIGWGSGLKNWSDTH